jgi:hypothetical protein
LYVFFCIGASISIGREIRCLPYAGFFAMHWNKLQSAALHCTSLHITALNCTVSLLHYIALHCTTLHCTKLN